jgi:hypothetical protein
MTQTQLSGLAANIASKYVAENIVRKADVIRDVVRTHKLNLEDSLILADCIIKGMYLAGKTIIVQG